MSKKPIDNLISNLKKDKVIPVIGAGVSFAVAKLPGWKGAIEHGFSYAEIRSLDNNLITDGRDLLEQNSLTAAADTLKKLLNAPNHPFSNWLEELFGGAKALYPDLLNSINDLCSPILLTTNYDNLLYSSSKLKTKEVFDWSEYQEVNKSLNSTNPDFILHLHGKINKPETIILSANDYAELAKQSGYKNILQRLWTQYHFLFIGCSKDGVMDDDFSSIFNFLNTWFPTNTHQHFILLNEKDINAGDHITLLNQCNIEAISIGNDYSKLPEFINFINPNKEKAIKLTLNLEKEIKENVDRQLRLPDGSITTSSNTINKLLKETLPYGIYWIDSLQLKFLEESLSDLNSEIKNKKQQFIFYQDIVKELVSIGEVQKSIKSWIKNRDNPAALNNDKFIDLAILCHACLKRVPNHILEEIKHRSPYAIHDYYYNGRLSEFIKEYKEKKDSKEWYLYRELYNSDNYFFENLKRIITSLEGFLKLNAEILFAEIPRSTITRKLKLPFLLFVKGDEISLCEQKHPYKIIACLKGERSLHFMDAKVLFHKNKILILGHTSQRCFYWNPEQDLSPNYFYTAESNKTIKQLFIAEEKPKLTIKIFSGEEIHTFINFEIKSTIKLNNDISILVSNVRSSLYSAKLYKNGPIIFNIDSNGHCSSLVDTIDLWNYVLEKPLFKKLIEIDKAKDNNFFNENHLSINVSEVALVKWGSNKVFAIRGQLNLLLKTSILFFVQILDTKFKILSCILIPKKLSIAFDTLINGDSVDLVLGYLATGNYPKYLVQVVKAINKQDIIIVEDGNYFFKSDGDANSDILDIVAASSDCIFALQNNEAIYKIDCQNGNIKKAKSKGLFKVIDVR